jgi:hypothetical protein
MSDKLIRRNATLVRKVRHCVFVIAIEDVVGERYISTGTADAIAIEKGDAFTVNWFPKGQCWIPFVPTATEIM